MAKKTASRTTRKTTKKTAKKTAKRTARRTTAKKAPAKAPAARKISASKDRRTKTEIYTALAEATELTRKDINNVFSALNEMIVADLKRGPKEFTIPGCGKFTIKRKPARRAGPGVNPFTGEKIMLKAKPAENQVKFRVTKALKDAVN